jgi:hypothetical protein
MTPELNAYDEGRRSGMAEATLEDVREDIAHIDAKVDRILDNCRSQCGRLFALRFAFFLYGGALAFGFAWLMKLTFRE